MTAQACKPSTAKSEAGKSLEYKSNHNSGLCLALGNGGRSSSSHSALLHIELGNVRPYPKVQKKGRKDKKGKENKG